jgi:hypothetical protein
MLITTTIGLVAGIISGTLSYLLQRHLKCPKVQLGKSTITTSNGSFTTYRVTQLR